MPKCDLKSLRRLDGGVVGETDSYSDRVSAGDCWGVAVHSHSYLVCCHWRALRKREPVVRPGEGFRAANSDIVSDVASVNVDWSVEGIVSCRIASQLDCLSRPGLGLG